MKLWSFDVRSGTPNQAALLEENEQAWKDHSYFIGRAQWDTNHAVHRKREKSEQEGTIVVLGRCAQ
jgi:hypothetical protein